MRKRQHSGPDRSRHRSRIARLGLLVASVLTLCAATVATGVGIYLMFSLATQLPNQKMDSGVLEVYVTLCLGLLAVALNMFRGFTQLAAG